jgi:Fe-S oxidoreductase
MDQDLVSEFKHKYESLAGIVHIAENEEAAAAVVLQILKEAQGQRGAEIEVIETGTCCGMAGTFGLKKGFLGYELSRAVGEPLFEGFKDAGVNGIVTESSVCRIHLQEGTGKKVWHPLELLRTDIHRQ